MTKIYHLVAVWKNEKNELQATRVAEGPSDKLAVDLAMCPEGTYRIALMEKKKFERLVQMQIEKKATEASSESAPQTSDESP